jgi:hypothetical protein
VISDAGGEVGAEKGYQSLFTDHRISRAGGIRTHDLLNPIQAATVCNSFAEKQLQISLPFQLYQIGRSY